MIQPEELNNIYAKYYNNRLICDNNIGNNLYFCYKLIENYLLRRNQRKEVLQAVSNVIFIPAMQNIKC